MTVRAGTTEDAAAVSALEVEAFGDDAWSPTLVADAVADLLVDEDGAELASYAVVTVAGDVADLQRIAVRRGARRGGVARSLLATVRARARDGGALRLLVEVSEVNAAARAFYAATGFVEIDRRRRYYRDGTDALVLAAEL